MTNRAPILALALAAFWSQSAAAEALFKYKGKSYEGKELSPSMQQTLHDLQSENYLRLESFVDQVIFDMHVEDEVKKTGKPRAQVEEGLFKVIEPSDKEVGQWFESNKGRIPPGYKLEQIAGDIKMLLKNEQKKKQYSELVAKLKKDGGLTLAMVEPEAPIFKIDASGFPMKGAAGAKLTIVEFADFQCPHCKHAGEALAKVLKKFEGKVNVVYMDFPLKGDVSQAVAVGGQCAHDQGKFWEYHDAAFQGQAQLTKDSPFKLAKDLKLDEAKFKACFDGEGAGKRVARARAEGDKIGLSGTPGLFLNGKRLRAHEGDELEQEIERQLKKAGAS